MKLRSLWIDDYRSLRDLELKFPDTPRLPITLVAGVNGTGKSSILRALAHIFNSLEYNQAPQIRFRLAYQISPGSESFEVRIEGDGHGIVAGIKFEVAIGGGPFMPREQGQWVTFLPNQIVIYTSGSLREWEPIFAETQLDRERLERDRAEALRAIQAGETDVEEITRDSAEVSLVAQVIDETIPSRTILLSQDHLRLALLATLALDDGHSADVRRRLYDRVGLKGLAGFMLRLRPLSDHALNLRLREYLQELLGEQAKDPDLVKRLNELTAQQNPRLPQRLLDRVRALAAYAIRSYRDLDGTFHLYFELNDATREYLVGAEGFSTALQFYREFLAELHARGVLTESDLVLYKTNVSDPILDRHLSDGESELLRRTALFLLMRDQRETLFLLDEPETHFNDVWKREMVDILSSVLDEQSSSAILLTTHSSIVLSDVEADQIVLLRKTETGHVERVLLRLPTLGADPSEILVTILGAAESIGKEAQDYLDAQLHRDWTIDNLTELESLIRRTGPGYHRSELRTIWRRLSAPQD